MSELQSLTLRAQDLSRSVDWWNTAMIWALVFAAIVAVAVVVTTRIALARTKQLADVQNRISDVKEAAAKIEQDRVGTELAKQETRAADAERRLLELQEIISWRTPDRALTAQLGPPLKRFAGQRFAFVSEFSDPERNNVVSWITVLLGVAEWRLEAAPSSFRSELTFQATNIVLWVSPTAPNGVLEAARALIPALERGGLHSVVLQSSWGPKPDAAPPELIRVVIFKKGPRMIVTGNMITFEGSPAKLFFGDGPPP